MAKFRCTECIHTNKDGVDILYCSVTGKPSAESQECPYYEDLEDQVEAEAEELPKHSYGMPNEEVTRILESHQDFGFALLGGFITTLCCAIIWAAVAVITKYQTGFGAILAGLLIGYSISFFGGGIDKKFGYLGAFFAFLACFLGNFFSQVVFLAQESYRGYMEVLLSLDKASAWSLMMGSSEFIDYIIYGLAVYSGYRLAFRKVNDETIRKIRTYESTGIPESFRQRQLALIVGLIIIVAAFFYANKGVNGKSPINYPSENPQVIGMEY